MNDRVVSKMWDIVAVSASKKDDTFSAITQSGWKSSFTGNYFSNEEMKEYVENTKIKLAKYLGSEKKVLEIGVASGLTCMGIAPLVGQYFGLDISLETLKYTNNRLKEKNIDNVYLIQGSAENVDKLIDVHDFDIVIINSVAQYFPNYEYFEKVLIKSIDCIKKKGIIYVGDILDLDMKENFNDTVKNYGGKHNQRDLFYSKTFMRKELERIPFLKNIEISDKVGEIQNELKTFRYDVLFEVDRSKDE